jgi:hypothetical protein
MFVSTDTTHLVKGHCDALTLSSCTSALQEDMEHVVTQLFEHALGSEGQSNGRYLYLMIALQQHHALHCAIKALNFPLISVVSLRRYDNTQQGVFFVRLFNVEKFIVHDKRDNIDVASDDVVLPEKRKHDQVDIGPDELESGKVLSPSTNGTSTGTDQALIVSNIMQ